MKPSTRIKELAEKHRQESIDPGFSPHPDISHYFNALLDYLDEQEEEKNEQQRED